MRVADGRIVEVTAYVDTALVVRLFESGRGAECG
jgi:ketosteroid isomerase-like protein